MNQAAWTTVDERGSRAGLWLTAVFYRLFGRRLSEWLDRKSTRLNSSH